MFSKVIFGQGDSSSDLIIWISLVHHFHVHYSFTLASFERVKAALNTYSFLYYLKDSVICLVPKPNFSGS